MPILTITGDGGKQSVLELQRPCPRIAYVRVAGFLSADIAKRITDYAAETVALNAPHDIVVFHDWFEVNAYDSEARRILTDFGAANKQTVTKSHICFRSKLVALGINVANALLGNLVGYASRENFLAVLEGAVAETKAAQVTAS